MFGEGLTHWYSVSRALQTHWYHVDLKVRHEDRMISLVVMPNDETKLDEILSQRGSDVEMTNVQVVTPPWMNKTSEWLMEKVEGVFIGVDSDEIPVCLLQVASGSIYSDRHGLCVTIESLTNVRKIY
ncbi:hypothetical protein D3C76_970850 [compost metagenome]